MQQTSLSAQNQKVEKSSKEISVHTYDRQWSEIRLYPTVTGGEVGGKVHGAGARARAGPGASCDRCEVGRPRGGVPLPGDVGRAERSKHEDGAVVSLSLALGLAARLRFCYLFIGAGRFGQPNARGTTVSPMRCLCLLKESPRVLTA